MCAAFDPDPTQPPLRIQMPHLQCRNGFPAHAGIAENQEQRRIPGSLPLPGRLDQRVHEGGRGDLGGRLATMRGPIQARHRVGGQHLSFHQPGTEARHR